MIDSWPILANLARYCVGLISWKSVAIVFALLNLKNWPFVWHIRVFRFFLTTPPFKPSNTEFSMHPLFRPVSIFSHSPFLELDFNLHKSNSTYFSDLDVSRTALVNKLCLPGYSTLKKKLKYETGKDGIIAPILAAAYIDFHKEIPAYTPYEIQSKVGSWDNKWLYIVTWFLTIQKPDKKEGGPADVKVHAVAVSKYVFKHNRRTVSPEEVFRASGLLPANENGVNEAGGSAGAEEGKEKSTESPEWDYKKIRESQNRAMEALESVIDHKGSFRASDLFNP